MASSTFNSDLFPRLRWMPQIWLAALTALAAFVISVAASTFHWFYDPTTIEKRLEAVVQHAILKRPSPRIIVLGTSRAAFGISPAIIERVSNLPALSVANWSYPAFGVAAYDSLVSAHKDKIAGADLVVIGIDPYFALAKPTPARAPEEAPAVARNWALDADQAIRQRMSLTLPVTQKMAWFLRELGGHLRLVEPFQLNWTMLPDGHWTSPGDTRALSRRNAVSESIVIAASYYEDKVVYPPVMEGWRRFLSSLSSANPNIMLVDLPMSPSFLTASRPYAKVVEANRRAFQDLSRALRIRYVEMTPAACGLGDDLFGDPVHVNSKGVVRLSECFARTLQELAAGGAESGR